MLGTICEKPVKDESKNREEEDTEEPKELVRGRSVGLEELDCGGVLVILNKDNL